MHMSMHWLHVSTHALLVHVGSQEQGLGRPSQYLARTMSWNAFIFPKKRVKKNTPLGPAGECIDAVSGELTFFTLPNCFELFGFDLMVDDQWHVWLLEVSA